MTATLPLPRPTARPPRTGRRFLLVAVVVVAVVAVPVVWVAVRLAALTSSHDAARARADRAQQASARHFADALASALKAGGPVDVTALAARETTAPDRYGHSQGAVQFVVLTATDPVTVAFQAFAPTDGPGSFGGGPAPASACWTATLPPGGVAVLTEVSCFDAPYPSVSPVVVTPG